jgi:hypothetical protein
MLPPFLQDAPLGNSDLLRESLVYLPATLAPLLLALLYPLASPGVRRTLALLMGTFAITLVGLALWKKDQILQLEVTNPFFDTEAGAPRVYVTGHSEAPYWHWCAAGAALVLLPALLMALRAKKKPAVPSPVLYGGLCGLWYVAVRLAFEHYAAPKPILWATGINAALLLVLPFVGYWCGRRKASWKGFLGTLLLLGLFQRGVIVAVGWVMTTRHLGTHLDVHAIEKAKLPFSGEVVFKDVFEQWLRLICIPQLLPWIVTTVLAGLLLGALPFTLARARK